MQTINDRLDIVLKKSGMTKTAFAESLNVSQQYISKLTRTGNPSNLLIEDICQKYSINETWLRTGKGNMDKQMSKDEETAVFVSALLEDDGENPLYDIIKSVMRTYNELSPKSQEILRDACAKLAENLKKEKES